MKLIGYIAAAILLLVIFYELWHARAPLPEPDAATSTSTPVAPSIQALSTPNPPNPTNLAAMREAEQARRWDALYAQFPYLPPPLALNMTGASLENVVTLLNSRIGTDRLQTVIPAQPLSYNVSFSGKTYGEALLAIDESNPIWLMPGITTRIHELPPSPRYFRSCARGPFFFAARISHSTSTREPYMLNAALAIDPRLTAVDFSRTFTLGADDKGQPWTLQNISGAGRPRGTGVEMRGTLAAPASPGTKLSRLSLAASITIQETSAQLDLQNAETLEGRSFQLGPATVSINQLRIIDGTITANGQTTQTRRLQFDLTSSLFGIVDYRIRDANGVTHIGGTIRRTTSTRGFSATEGSGTAGSDVTGPLTLHLEAPDKTTRTDVTFELVDLPIPD